MKFIITDEIDDDELYALLDRNKYLLSDYYNCVVNKKKFIENETSNYINNHLNITRFFISNNKLEGFCSLEKLDWDSHVFNKNMWKMKVIPSVNLLGNLNELKTVFMGDCNKNKIKHITCQVKSNDYVSTCILEGLGFKVVDSIIRYGAKIDRLEINCKSNQYDAMNICEYKPEYYAKVLKLSNQVFSNYPNRFYNDGQFAKAECKKMYNEWTKNSLNGFADIVIVSEKDGNIYGFSTVKYKKPFYDDGIIVAEGQLSCVLDSFRGSGLNTKMLTKKLEIACKKADFYEAGTQIYNFASQKTFYKCGLKPIDSYFTFHISL